MSSAHIPDIGSLFETALGKYKERTGTNLIENELSSELESCETAESVIKVLQGQAQGFRNHSGDGGKMVSRFKQVINVLAKLSASPVLVELIGIVPFSPAKAIFAAIGVLVTAIRDVNGSYDALGELFELFENFLRRLNIYVMIKVQSATALTEIVVKILVELLATLGLATRHVKQGKWKKLGKKLLGEKDVEELLQKLDRLMQEESRTTTTLTLEIIYGFTESTREFMENEKKSANYVRELIALLQEKEDNDMRKSRNQSRERSRRWLTPPDPSKNQNFACEICHNGTATWFVQGTTFLEWKTRRSLLWIHGKPGSGKSILCSTVITYIKSMQDAETAMAYFYFDFGDVEKRNRRGFLTSLLVQFDAQSDECCDILSQLYSEHDHGLHQPNDQALLDCLKDMLTKLGQTYIIVDALDECPTISGTPSAREQVLNLVTDLVNLENTNLHLCVTSRPEADVWKVLQPLATHSVSLHDEMGQMGDIDNYISFFVNSDNFMSQLREEERDLIIHKLRQEAAGMFRWVFCQLDTLRRCLPARIRTTLDELPRSLDATYERTLQDIVEANWEYAHRLFQCIAVSSRPLRVEELAEFLAIDFDAGGIPKLVAGWRPPNPANAVLSVCSSLIAFVIVDDSLVVQFSHFSVKEFLTSSRFASERISRYRISFEPAHTIVVQACLSILLQLANHVNKRSIEINYPLARYAAQHWVEHAKFQKVFSSAEDAMTHLFDRDRHHFAAWVWIYDMDCESQRSMDSETPLQPSGLPIYYATLWDFPDLVEWLATTRSQDVNESGGYYGTPLCAAAARGCLRVAQVLVEYGAQVDATGGNGWPPLLWASDSGCLEISQLMLDHHADVNFRDPSNRTPLSLASGKGHMEIAMLLLQHGADPNVWEDGRGTVLIKALQREDLEFAELLLTYLADVNAQDGNGLSLLDQASEHKGLASVQWLLDHGAKFSARNIQRWTPFPEGDPTKQIGEFEVQSETIDLTAKRRALLVGISYAYSQSDTWWPLENPHVDVDMFRNLLAGVYGYSPEDITVLKDGPDFPDHLQPTRANMIRELTRLVADAASGDKFTFFYSGHSDQQKSFDDISIEEDGQDEVIITSDIQRIVDNELNDILVKPLPVGTFLLAVFDTCHSGTMLDLPHYYCNSVYVPWCSKGERVTLTLRNNNVRRYARGLSGHRETAPPLTSTAGVMAQDTGNNIQFLTDPIPSSSPRLGIDTQVGENTDEGQLNRGRRSTGGAYTARESFLSPTRCDSPVSDVTCDGWCRYDPLERRIVLSLSACSDPQRAWEGPQGSLATLLCGYLERHPRPSYRNLMSHVNFALHENARELHTYTRQQRKGGNNFDGELDNFQEPMLSSLAKLNMDDTLDL